MCQTVGAWIETSLENVCNRWGRLCTRRPVPVFFAGLLVSGLFSLGIVRLKIITDPVALWSASSSQARQERSFFDRNFG